MMPNTFITPTWITREILSQLRRCHEEPAAKALADAVDDAFEARFAECLPGMIRARRALAKLQASIGNDLPDALKPTRFDALYGVGTVRVRAPQGCVAPQIPVQDLFEDYE